MKNKSRIGYERAFIDNDLTFQERRIRERTLEMARNLKKNGTKVKIGFNKLIGEESVWIWSQKEIKWFQKEKRKEN